MTKYKKSLTVLLTATLLFANFGTVNASKLSDIKDKQDAVKDEQKELEFQKDKIEKSEANVESQIKVLDGKLEVTREQLREKRAEIDKKTKENEKLKVEIEETKERIALRQEILADRARTLQKTGGTVSYMEVILGASDFGDLLRRVSAVNRIVDADRSIVEQQEADKAALETKSAQVEANLKSLSAAAAKIKSLESDLEKQSAEKESVLNTLQSRRAKLDDQLVSLEEEQALLKRQEQIIKEQIANSNNNNNNNNNNGGGSSSGGSSSGGGGGQYPPPSSGAFQRPAVGPVTSEFGPRWGTFHYGIDIGKRGSDVPIVAAADGVVINSYYSSSYGNVVFLNHNIDGRTYTTVYAHMENRAVSAGQRVSRGQFLGYMGNTGMSQGAHLHFE
ncbi:MAG: murein hydrolase activator EnvC family protein, partial [Bacilli bacterium]